MKNNKNSLDKTWLYLIQLIVLCAVILLSPFSSAKDRIQYHVQNFDGSTLKVINEQGIVSQSYQYAPFGQQLQLKKPTNLKNPNAFVGGVQDAGDLVYLKQRHYNPVLGRFYQPDPLTFLSGGQINTYQYAGNDSFSFKDANGLNLIALGQAAMAEANILCARFCIPSAQIIEGLFGPPGMVSSAPGTLKYALSKNTNSLSKFIGNSETPQLVFRVLRAEENPLIGIFAKNSAATYKVEGHVLNGSKETFKSQYISTTSSFSVAEEWSKKTGGRIVMIDLARLKSNIVIDLSSRAGQDMFIKGNRAKNYANTSSEILIIGNIPKEAIFHPDVRDIPGLFYK